MGLAYPPSSYQSDSFPYQPKQTTNTKKPLTLSAMVKKAKQKENQFDLDYTDEDNTAESEDDSNLNAKKSQENKYDLATVLRYLQSGYYIRYLFDLLSAVALTFHFFYEN